MTASWRADLSPGASLIYTGVFRKAPERRTPRLVQLPLVGNHVEEAAAGADPDPILPHHRCALDTSTYDR